MIPSLRINTDTDDCPSSLIQVIKEPSLARKLPQLSPEQALVAFSVFAQACVAAPYVLNRTQTTAHYANDTVAPMELCLTVQQEEEVEHALFQCKTPAHKEELANHIITATGGNANNLTFFQKEALLRVIHSYAHDLQQNQKLAFAIFKQASSDLRNLTFVQLHALDLSVNTFATELKTNDASVSAILQNVNGHLKNLTFIQHEAFRRMGHSVRTLDLSGLMLTCDDAKLLPQYFPNVRTLTAQNSNLSEEHLSQFKGFERLTSLDVANCSRICDVALRRLRGFTELETLNLSGCSKLTDRGIVAIVEAIFDDSDKMKKLRLITLQSCPHVTQESTELLMQASGLQVIL